MSPSSIGLKYLNYLAWWRDWDHRSSHTALGRLESQRLLEAYGGQMYFFYGCGDLGRGAGNGWGPGYYIYSEWVRAKCSPRMVSTCNPMAEERLEPRPWTFCCLPSRGGNAAGDPIWCSFHWMNELFPSPECLLGIVLRLDDPKLILEPVDSLYPPLEAAVKELAARGGVCVWKNASSFALFEASDDAQQCSHGARHIASFLSSTEDLDLEGLKRSVREACLGWRCV